MLPMSFKAQVMPMKCGSLMGSIGSIGRIEGRFISCVWGCLLFFCALFLRKVIKVRISL
jgi:hypothetical protein